ncbi:Hypothetical_protein [Hexamita inflata]|uniref:Hypothetical_protein n=1 Tax=Hexamita inflata TaxID=28002 RepID=A0ABP1HKN3_9EUKA
MILTFNNNYNYYCQLLYYQNIINFCIIVVLKLKQKTTFYQVEIVISQIDFSRIHLRSNFCARPCRRKRRWTCRRADPAADTRSTETGCRTTLRRSWRRFAEALMRTLIRYWKLWSARAWSFRTTRACSDSELFPVVIAICYLIIKNQSMILNYLVIFRSMTFLLLLYFKYSSMIMYIQPNGFSYEHTMIWNFLTDFITTLCLIIIFIYFGFPILTVPHPSYQSFKSYKFELYIGESIIIQKMQRKNNRSLIDKSIYIYVQNEDENSNNLRRPNFVYAARSQAVSQCLSKYLKLCNLDY